MPQESTVMDWDKLRIFHAVADAGSLTHAGDVLHLSQSAVSRQIRALEAHLGLSLFERSANSTVLRDWGARYFETVSGNLENIALASVAIRGDENGEEPPELPMESDQERILIVDDMPANIRRLHDVLHGRYQVVAHTRAEDALDWLLAGGEADLIMLDVRMTGMDGYALCRRLKAMPRLAKVPVMFLTSLDAPEDETEGFSVGACDYVARPFAPAVLLARIRVQLDLRRSNMALENLLQRRADRLERAEALLAGIRRSLADFQG